MSGSDTGGEVQTDLRPDDIDLLDRMGAGGFGRIWADELHRTKSADRNQERWHLARMAYLAGRLIERGYTHQEAIDILKEHRDQSNHE